MNDKHVGELSFWSYLLTKFNTAFWEIFSIIIAFFAPIGTVALAVGFAVVVDTFFGRWRAKYAPNKKEKVTSKKTRVGFVNKSIGYMLVVILSCLIDYAFINEIVSWFFEGVEFVTTKILGLMFCAIEYTSVNESYKAVKGKSIPRALRNLLKQMKIVKEELKEFKDDKDA